MADTKRSFGWIADLPDQRDQPYNLLKLHPPAVYPDKVDLRPQMPPIENQKNLGSCTANALVGALEFLEKKDTPKDPFLDLSRLFLYYNERVLLGPQFVSVDSGARLRDGIKTLASDGVCAENIWKYDVNRFRRKPSLNAYTRASHHKIQKYYRLETLDDMLHCLSQGYPFVFGFTVYASFMSLEVQDNGVVPMPHPSENVVGGHACVAVGYDQSTKRFIARNSWSVSWGANGNFTIPFDYLKDRNLSDDMWYVTK